MSKIAVLLTVHNRKEKTLWCLRNLFSQQLPDNVSLDVFLTDDGCTDGTPEAVKTEFPDVAVIKGDGSLFWNRGMIAAWEAAAKSNRFDYYLWLNDDTNLNPNAIASLLKVSHEASNKAIIVGSTCATNNPAVTTYGGRNKNGNLIEADDKPIRCETFNGNIVLVPQKVFQILGTMDKMFRHSLGDFDYGLRATETGIPIYIAPGYLGTCDTHEFISKWCDPKQPLKIRWRHFMSPTGANPFEFFKFKRRHKGLLPASLTFVSNFIHVLYPRLWA